MEYISLFTTLNSSESQQNHNTYFQEEVVCLGIPVGIDVFVLERVYVKVKFSVVMGII